MEMEYKRTTQAIKEHENLTKSPKTTCSVTYHQNAEHNAADNRQKLLSLFSKFVE